MTSQVSAAVTPNHQSSVLPMMIIGTLFFIFGFVTWLNGALIPFLQMVCDLTETQALFIASCFYAAYVVMALPMSMILDKTGYKNGMALGLVIVAAGLLLFVPAAMSREFAVFLLAQFVVGSGLTILQTASNPYIVKIGPQDSAAARIAIMGLLNKGAGVLAPLLFTALILGDFAGVSVVSLAELSEAEREAQISSMSHELIVPYVVMSLVLLVLTAGLKRSALPELDMSKEDSQNPSSVSQDSILKHPQLVLGAIALFFYVGVEVIAGDTIGLYGSKLGLENSTSLTSYTMVAMVVGYLLGLVLIPRYLSQAKALLLSAAFGIVLTVLIQFVGDDSHAISSIIWGWSGIATTPDTITLIALLGLANAMVWPAIWPLALTGLGNLTARGSAVLIMGIAGGALLPLVYGAMSESFGSQPAYLIMLPCYLFIAHYAISGHRKRQW